MKNNKSKPLSNMPTWDMIFFIWESTLDSFGVDVNQIIIDIDLKKNRFKCPEHYFSWWPKGDLEGAKGVVSKSFDDNYHPYLIKKSSIDRRFRPAEISTLDMLWSVKNEPEKIAGLLLSASIFDRRYRGNFPINHWPEPKLVDELFYMTVTRWQGEGRFSLWNRSCSSVLPILNRDTDFQINEIKTLIRYLAIEHCQLLSKYQPVRVNCGTS
jgi:hypothetical protein